jgi:hypothetical protein
MGFKKKKEVTRYSLCHLRNWELKRQVRRIYSAIVLNRSCVYHGGVNRDMFVLDIKTGLWPCEAEHASSSSIHSSQKVRRNHVTTTDILPRETFVLCCGNHLNHKINCEENVQMFNFKLCNIYEGQ